MEHVGSIFLIGFMGVGKSTVGPLLSARLHLPFIDLDAEIERAVGQPIRDLFRDRGESGFRALESAALRRVAESTVAMVVAVGGGAPTVPDNLQVMRRAGVVLLLSADVPTLVGRLQPGPSVPPAPGAAVDSGRPDRPSRPLLAALRGDRLAQEVAALHERRASAYAQADLVVDTAGLLPQDVAGRAAEALRGYAQDPRHRQAGAGGGR